MCTILFNTSMQAQMSYRLLAIITAPLREASCAPADENSARRAGLTPDGISALVVGLIGISMMAFSVWVRRCDSPEVELIINGHWMLIYAGPEAPTTSKKL